MCVQAHVILFHRKLGFSELVVEELGIIFYLFTCVLKRMSDFIFTSSLDICRACIYIRAILRLARQSPTRLNKLTPRDCTHDEWASLGVSMREHVCAFKRA